MHYLIFNGSKIIIPLRNVFNMKNYTTIFLLFLGLLASCSNYAKLVKGSDYDLKWATAKQFYEEGKYVKCAELLEQVMPRFRFTDDAEEMSWIYANCFYNMRDYYSAVTAFQNFYNTFQYGPYAEDAYYHIAMCNYILSPRAELDQEYTTTAINDFSYFVAKYPNSSRVDECNEKIKELNDRLAEKSYLSARLYYDMDQYKAAITALTNSLNTYSDSKFREEMMFLRLSSLYKYAVNSVPDRQQERYQETFEEYFSFSEEFPSSIYSREARRIYISSAKFLNIDVQNTETTSDIQ